MNKAATNINGVLRLRKAYNRVEQLKKFYLRLGVYLTVNLLLLIVWLYDPYIAENFWIPTSFFTTFLAGLFIIANAVNLYGQHLLLPRAWEQRKINELIDKQNQPTIKYK